MPFKRIEISDEDAEILREVLDLIGWRMAVDRPEFIESHTHKLHWAEGLRDSHSEDELNRVCKAVDAVFQAIELPHRLNWDMGVYVAAITKEAGRSTS